MLHKTLISIGLLLCLTSLVFAQDRPILQDETAQANWRENLQYLIEKMPTVHPNLYWRTPEADFKILAAELDGDIPYLTEEQIKVRADANRRTRRWTYPNRHFPARIQFSYVWSAPVYV